MAYNPPAIPTPKPPSDGDPDIPPENPPPPDFPNPKDCGAPTTVNTDGVEERLDYRGQDWLRTPIPGALHALPLYTSANRSGGELDPNLASPPDYQRNPHLWESLNGQVASWLPGYGDGIWALTPGEFEAWDVYGEDELPGSRWPAHPPQVTLLLMSAARSADAETSYTAAGVSAEAVETYLAWGKAHQTRRTPSDGIYAKLDTDSQTLEWTPTNTDGTDNTTVGGFSVRTMLTTMGREHAVTSIDHTQTGYTPDNNEEVIFCDTSSNTLEISLPASPENGRLIVVKNIGRTGNSMDIRRNGGTINGAASDLSLADTETVWLMARNGNDWETL